MKKLAIIILAVLALSRPASANIVVWLNGPDNHNFFVVVWMIENVERKGQQITIRTSSTAITVVPDAAATVLHGVNGTLAFYYALDKMLGPDAALSDNAYAAAQKELKSGVTDKDADARVLDAAVVLGYTRRFPCSSITVRDTSTVPETAPVPASHNQQ